MIGTEREKNDDPVVSDSIDNYGKKLKVSQLMVLTDLAESHCEGASIAWRCGEEVCVSNTSRTCIKGCSVEDGQGG